MRPLCVHHTSDRGPLDSDMKVNPLAMRYDGTEDTPRDPRFLGSLHTCPVRTSTHSDKAVTFVYSRLVEGQGLLFWTRWTMHTALPIMDENTKEISENCRTSFEFRFWFIGKDPVPGGTPQTKQSGVLLEQQEETAGTGAARRRSGNHAADKTGNGSGHTQTPALTPEQIKTLEDLFGRFLREDNKAHAQDTHGTEVVVPKSCR